MMTLTNRLPHIFGGRIFKTAFSAFLTAYICEALGWPPLFAVMTAIVTIEPTSADSIRKGLVRFPASIMGAGFAMVFEAFFHHSALTYTLASVSTLYACHKLKLHDGLVVATLTSVAMVTVTHAHYLDSFFVRMGTTFTGIFVSSVVNFFVFPPKYEIMIQHNVTKLYRETGEFLDKFLQDLTTSKRKYKNEYDKLCKDLEHAFKLVYFQRAEWTYHKHRMTKVRELNKYHRKLEYLQKVMYHIGNLLYQQVPNETFNVDERQLIQKVGKSLSDLYKAIDRPVPEDHYDRIDQLNKAFCEVRENALRSKNHHYHHHFSPKLIIMYELLSLHDVIEELQQLASRYLKHIQDKDGTNEAKIEV